MKVSEAKAALEAAGEEVVKARIGDVEFWMNS